MKAVLRKNNEGHIVFAVEHETDFEKSVMELVPDEGTFYNYRDEGIHVPVNFDPNPGAAG